MKMKLKYYKSELDLELDQLQNLCQTHKQIQETLNTCTEHPEIHFTIKNRKTKIFSNLKHSFGEYRRK